MFDKILFNPGASTAGDVVTIPTHALGIDQVVSAFIYRVGGNITLDDHDEADVIACIADHLAGDTIATLLDHPAHGHQLEDDVSGTTLDADIDGGLLRVAGAPAIPDFAAMAHAASATDIAHGAVAATELVHAVTAADPITAVTATKLSDRTIELNINTLAGDTMQLVYVPEGRRLRVA